MCSRIKKTLEDLGSRIARDRVTGINLLVTSNECTSRVLHRFFFFRFFSYHGEAKVFIFFFFFSFFSLSFFLLVKHSTRERRSRDLFTG